MHLVCGNGDISLELSLEEIEAYVRPLLQGRKASAGMELASKPKRAGAAACRERQ